MACDYRLNFSLDMEKSLKWSTVWKVGFGKQFLGYLTNSFRAWEGWCSSCDPL